MKTLIRMMTPQSTSQWYLWFCVWLCLFNVVHLGLLALFGRAGASPVWMTILIATLTCIPFLSAAFGMLRLHLHLQNRLYLASRTDLLTRMPNRRSFMETVDRELLIRGGIIMMVDIDRFKNINDTYGHEFGDECLRRIADHIKPVVLNSYVYGRLGGEEFGIMLFGGSTKMAEDIGAIVASGIRIKTPRGRKPLPVTCSVGCAAVVPGDSLSDALSRADSALYYAKENGRARMVMYEDIVPSETRLLPQIAS